MALFSGTTQMSQYQKGKTNLNFTEARDSEWQWHQLGRMQVCTSLQTDNHASTPLLVFTDRFTIPYKTIWAVKCYIFLAKIWKQHKSCIVSQIKTNCCKELLRLRVSFIDTCHFALQTRTTKIHHFVNREKFITNRLWVVTKPTETTYVYNVQFKSRIVNITILAVKTHINSNTTPLTARQWKISESCAIKNCPHFNIT